MSTVIRQDVMRAGMVTEGDAKTQCHCQASIDELKMMKSAPDDS